jgi:hypothetical protein
MTYFPLLMVDAVRLARDYGKIALMIKERMGLKARAKNGEF